MPSSINGSNGGASAPSGDGVATVVSGAFVSPVPSASSTRTTLGLGSLATASSVTSSQVSDSTTAGRALLTAGDSAAQRTSLGLGSLATASSVTASQVSDSTLAGRALLTAADAPAQRTSLGLGSLATASSVTASQVSDSTTAGRALLTAADAPAQRTSLGLGALATASTITSSQVSDSTTAGRALLTGADAPAQRTSLGLGSLATASTVTASQISDSTTAGRALLTAADAPAQRTSLGLGGAALLSVGTTAGTVAAGNAAFANPMTASQDLIVGGASGAAGRLGVGAESTVLTVSGGAVAWVSPAVVRVAEPMLAYPPAVAFSRTPTTGSVDLAMDTGWTLIVVGKRKTGQGAAGTLEGLVGYGTIGTGFYIGATNSGANNTGDPVVAILYGNNLNAAGVSTQAQLGQSLPAPGAPGANFCVAIEVRSSTIAISVNGAAATTVTRTGTYVPPNTTSDLYLGARFNDSAATHFGLAEIAGIQQAVGDAALASLSSAGLAAMTVQTAMSATNRTNAKFVWCAADGGTQLRVGEAPITQTGIVPFGFAT